MFVELGKFANLMWSSNSTNFTIRNSTRYLTDNNGEMGKEWGEKRRRERKEGKVEGAKGREEGGQKRREEGGRERLCVKNDKLIYTQICLTSNRQK